jgi:hypothetical protein
VTPRPSTTPASAQTTSPPTPPSTRKQSLTTPAQSGDKSVLQLVPRGIRHANMRAQLITLAVPKTPSASMSQPRPQPHQRPVPSPDRPQTLPARPSSAVSVAAAVLHRLVAAAARLALPLPFSSARLTVCLPLLPVSSAALLFFSKKRPCF